ncbi:MAG: DUF1566 domain-containing protein, partial [Candidatus Paceibacterota bacterium]
LSLSLSPKLASKNKHGFTLIELLVVIAIIGILASVVLASLNSARSKGTETAIQSNLRNMMTQAEVLYDGNYSAVCAGVAGMLTAIDKTGGHSACYSFNNSGLADVNLRWGASAKNSDGSKNWSSDMNGVVTWDTANTGTIMAWNAANTACAAAGGRLPSLEELKSLYDAYGATPTGFTAYNYWSGTTVPSNSARAYNVDMGYGDVYSNSKTVSIYVRCVR